MPLYEYQCDACGRFEKIVKFSDPPLDACPSCGGAVQKLFSSPAIQFKGSGWYITDYAKKSSSESSGGSRSGSSDKSEKTKESKSGETAKDSGKSDAPAAAAPAASTPSKD